MRRGYINCDEDEESKAWTWRGNQKKKKKKKNESKILSDSERPIRRTDVKSDNIYSSGIKVVDCQCHFVEVVVSLVILSLFFFSLSVFQFLLNP